MSRWPMVPLSEVLTPVSRPELVDPVPTYRLLGAHWYAGGLHVKDTLVGSQIRATNAYRVEEGDFVYNRLFAWKGSFAIATRNLHGCLLSNEFPCFRIRPETQWTVSSEARRPHRGFARWRVRKVRELIVAN